MLSLSSDNPAGSLVRKSAREILQNGHLYPTSTHKQHWYHDTLEENLLQSQEFSAELSKHTLLPNLVSFGVSSSPLFERYIFRRTRCWLRGRSLSLLTLCSISVSTIHVGVPGILQLLCLFRNRVLNSDFNSLQCSHVSAAIRDTVCTAEPKITWNSIVQ